MSSPETRNIKAIKIYGETIFAISFDNQNIPMYVYDILQQAFGISFAHTSLVRSNRRGLCCRPKKCPLRKNAFHAIGLYWIDCSNF